MVTYDSSKIKLARECHNLTQQQLADMVGTSRQQIAQWEQDDKGITVNSLAKVANALDCPIKFFFIAKPRGI